MPIVLAGMAATVFGVADFLGGTAARRMHAVAVTMFAQVSGLLVLVFVASLLFPARLLPASLAWGALAGVMGGIGLPMLYRSLAIGPMNVVAPLTALTSSVVPVIAGTAFGERPSPLAWLGIALAVIAGVVVGIASGPSPALEADSFREADSSPGAGSTSLGRQGRSARGVLYALVSGFCFGGFYVLLAQAPAGAGIWPVAAARLAGCAVAGVVLVVALRGRAVSTGAGIVSVLSRGSVSWAGWRLAAVSGVLDASANALYLLAVQHGQLAVVGSIMGLYPASTVLLARYLHGERIGPVQRVGLLLAVPAMVLVGGG